MLVNITKKLVIVFIIGILIGAIITTAGFLIFSKVCKTGDAKMTPPSFSQSDNSNLPEINGRSNNGNFNNNGQPPQMPNGNGNGNSDSQGNNQLQLPEAPDGNNSNNQSQVPGTNSF